MTAPASAAPWQEFARAPLVPVAVAAGLGLVLDRYLMPSAYLGLVVAAVGLAGWITARVQNSAIAILFLWGTFAGLAMAYHHASHNARSSDNLAELLGDGAALVKLRASLIDDPATRHPPKDDPFRPSFREDRDTVLIRATAVAGRGGDWIAASGTVRLSVERDAAIPGEPPLLGLRAGDEIEVVGTFRAPRSAGNPGEKDFAQQQRDAGICGDLWVSDTSAAVTRLGPATATDGWLAALRRRANGILRDNLSDHQAATAAALLLGDGTAMERATWDRYVRTGVVHALAISGQHLAVLAGFLWLGLRAVGVRRSRGAWLVLAIIVGYTLLTGLRPSGVRSAAMVAAICGGLILRRPTRSANAFALGFLAVVALNPTDPFTLGCQLSFLSVFVLVWGVGRWVQPAPLSPTEQLIDDSRSVLVKLIRAAVRWLIVGYLISLVIWVANAPLLAADQNLVSPVGLVVGPPIVVLTSIALIAGFLLFLVAPLGPVAVPFAVAVDESLSACEWLVTAADQFPGGSIYVPGPPNWWLVGFYLAVVAFVLVDTSWRRRLGIGLGAWILIGLAVPAADRPTDEMQVTFLAVGKGGCTVIETPDGRCLVYDAGTTAGPAAVKRVVAPFLWSRGISRIDELFVSHADADHFNGMGELLRRFPVGRVTVTPSFAEKETREVAAALLAMRDAGVERRVAVAGDRFEAGAVSIEVLHPPLNGPAGTENERSLVLLVSHAGHSVLLTGDLEKAGAAAVLGQGRRRVDVLMAPHHGSRAALPQALLTWAEPKIVVVNRGPALGNTIGPTAAGPEIAIWDTDTAGAITLRSHRSGLTAEVFRTGERKVVVRGGT